MVATVRHGAGVRFVWAIGAASLVPFLAAPTVQWLGLSDTALWVLAATVLGVAHVGTTAAFYVDPDMRPILSANPRRYYLAPVVFVAVGLFYGAVAAHFVIDGGVWKMRSAAQRELLRRRFAFL